MATTVALFGGSFNPPHVAHALVALYVLETAPVDAVWLVPTWRHAFGKELAPYEDRVAMCALAAAPLGPRALVSRVEEEVARVRGGESRTLHTLEHLATTHPGHAFRLLVGADILGEAASWHRWDEICRRAPPIVVGRGAVTPPPGAAVTELSMPAVSSTEVRRRLAAGQDVAGLVSRTVLGYIAGRGLYR
ncbi:MAG: nicotinate-nicotinamide nucleotide adenylyltransferase [Kofleriaceae bacterium]|nr:nicotinate-nicotinamide nucleotide adenylyltransferase [Kofleriaceae bacterium]MCL4227788.1 nicotinate-nicotinamide nucleotide adenylyltransferase [Myxococcales bacterium]